MSKEAIDTSGPAFPSPASQYEDETTEYSCREQEGMSLRDWFAGQIAAGIYKDGGINPEKAAWFIYQCADALLAERKKALL